VNLIWRKREEKYALRKVAEDARDSQPLEVRF
jgi:hypothetical protein